MSAIDWICKKISLESASGQLSAITISGQQGLRSKLDACANVTTCCCPIVQFETKPTQSLAQPQNSPIVQFETKPTQSLAQPQENLVMT